MFNLHDDNDFEPEHSASVTDQVLTDLQLYLAATTQSSATQRHSKSLREDLLSLSQGLIGLLQARSSRSF